MLLHTYNKSLCLIFLKGWHQTPMLPSLQRHLLKQNAWQRYFSSDILWNNLLFSQFCWILALITWFSTLHLPKNLQVVGVPVTMNGDLKNQFVEANVGFDTVCKVLIKWCVHFILAFSISFYLFYLFFSFWWFSSPFQSKFSVMVVSYSVLYYVFLRKWRKTWGSIGAYTITMSSCLDLV